MDGRPWRCRLFIGLGDTELAPIALPRERLAFRKIQRSEIGPSGRGQRQPPGCNPELQQAGWR